MNKQLHPNGATDRRTFMRSAVACVGLGLVGSCSKSPNDVMSAAGLQVASEPKAAVPKLAGQSVVRGGGPGSSSSAEAILGSIDHLADAHVRMCHHCAQASFLALDDAFGFGQPAILKALTPLPGIAERGETCGAVTGCLMALGLVFGRERLDDWEGWRASLVPARKFCERFEKEFGSTMCADIVERLTGHRLNLYDPADLARFQIAGATELTSGVVRKAVRIAAELILDRSAR